MPNIWGIVVGVVLAAGVGVVVVKAVGDNSTPSRARTATPASQTQAGAHTDAQAVPRVAPQPDARFGKIEVSDDDFAIGRADAPVTIIEYASLTCPHCARFHIDTVAAIKKDYIDTGKVRLVYRDFPLDHVALSASMIARCSGRDSFFGFLETFFASQASWARAENPVDALSRIARLGGMSDGAVQECLKNQTVMDAVVKQRLEGERIYAITSTPTIIVNGGKFSGGLGAEELKLVLDPLLPKT